MVVVAETADTSPVRRVRGAYVATAMAEYFRKQRKTRFAFDGFSYPFCDGTKRNWKFCGRSADVQRLPGFGLYFAGSTGRTSRKLGRRGKLNRLVYGPWSREMIWKNPLRMPPVPFSMAILYSLGGWRTAGTIRLLIFFRASAE